MSLCETVCIRRARASGPEARKGQYIILDLFMIEHEAHALKIVGADDHLA